MPGHDYERFMGPLVIRNRRSGLVLDASEYEVKLHQFHGGPSQIWELKKLRSDTWRKYGLIILNKGNGKVLDVEGGANRGHNLITSTLNVENYRGWHIISDTICSATEHLVVDICSQNYFAGENLIVNLENGEDTQKFIFEAASKIPIN